MRAQRTSQDLVAALAAAALAGCTGAIGSTQPGEPGDGTAGPGDSAGSGGARAPGGASTRPGAPGASADSAGLPAAALAPVSGMRRLNSVEYDNTLRDLLRDESRPSRQILPADARIPFDNDFMLQVPSRALVDGLELLAREAVQRLMADRPRRDGVVGCAPTGPTDAACFRGFLSRFGRRALRRPLDAAEIARFEKVFLPLAGEAGDFYAAVEASLQTFLQHLELVYRVEIGAPVAAAPGVSKLSTWEVGARLAYFLWASPPDDALLDAAQSGALATGAGVRNAAVRMLKDQRARDLVARFHALWLHYEGMQAATPELGRAMQEETSALLRRVIFDEQRPWQDIFRSAESFVPDLLARHYGLPAPGSATGKWVSYGSSGRRGVLSHATFLSNGTAKGGDSSPTMRGIAVRELLLCEEVPEPPPGVNADEPPPVTAAAKCKEDRYAVHRQGSCAGCHALLDPVGFGLESYDPQGRFRTKEAEQPTCLIRGEGEVVGLGKFKGPSELGDVLLRSGKLGGCAVSHLYRFAVGRQALDTADKELVALLGKKTGAAAGDFRFDDLILDLVSSDAFRHRREEK